MWGIRCIKGFQHSLGYTRKGTWMTTDPFYSKTKLLFKTKSLAKQHIKTEFDNLLREEWKISKIEQRLKVGL